VRGVRRFVAFLLLGCVCGVVPADAQVEVDRVLQRVGDQVITQLDVRRARVLKLVSADDPTDAEIQRLLENHWLMVAEVARFSPASPGAADIAAERERWRSQLGSGADVDALLVRAGMTEDELDTWFRDTLRIRTYIDNRFGAVPPAERQAAIDDWVHGLRERAGLR